MLGKRTAALLAATIAVYASVASPTAASPEVRVSGVVLSADRSVRTMYFANASGRVLQVLAKRVLPVGTRIAVRGTLQADGWTVLATGLSDRVTRTGTVRRVRVRGQLGFVDRALLRFQLAAHGQIVADVRFPGSLADRLARLSLTGQNRTWTFALAIVRGSLHLRAHPR